MSVMVHSGYNGIVHRLFLCFSMTGGTSVDRQLLLPAIPNESHLYVPIIY